MPSASRLSAIDASAAALAQALTDLRSRSASTSARASAVATSLGLAVHTRNDSSAVPDPVTVGSMVAARAGFAETGFTIIDRLIPQECCDRLNERLEAVLRGQFDDGCVGPVRAL